MHRYLHLGVAASEWHFKEVMEIIPMIASDWIFYSGSTWVLWTEHEAAFINGALRAKLGEKAMFLLLEIDLTKPVFGFMPGPIWDWLNTPRIPTNRLLHPPRANPNQQSSTP